MLRKHKIRKLSIIFIFVLLVMSVGYSALQQNLSLSGTATLKKEDKPDNYEVNDNPSSWGTDKIVYQFQPSITYKGTDKTTSWEIIIDIPDDSELVNSWNGIFKIENGNLIISNDQNNKEINPGGTVSFGFQIKSDMTNYQLNIIEANFYSPVKPDPKEEIFTDGINVRVEGLSGWYNGNKYVSQIYVYVTNNTGVDLSSWEVNLVRPINSNIVNLWGGSYIEKDDVITLSAASWESVFRNGETKNVGIQIEANDRLNSLEVSNLIGRGIIE